MVFVQISCSLSMACRRPRPTLDAGVDDSAVQPLLIERDSSHKGKVVAMAENQDQVGNISYIPRAQTSLKMAEFSLGSSSALGMWMMKLRRNSWV